MAIIFPIHYYFKYKNDVIPAGIVSVLLTQLHTKFYIEINPFYSFKYIIFNIRMNGPIIKFEGQNVVFFSYIFIFKRVISI